MDPHPPNPRTGSRWMVSLGITSLCNRFVGQLVEFRHRERTDPRGLSQSTENAILLTGAVALAITVVGLVTAFVKGKLANLG